MRVIRSVSIDEIEDHLESLGNCNHSDNMGRVREHPFHALVELDESDFGNLVFLANSTVRPICPCMGDRRLRKVAECALEKLKAGNGYLGANWDLAKVAEKSSAFLRDNEAACLPTLVLRDLRGSERKIPDARWYLQDGCHRALGYSMKVLEGEAVYSKQTAFVATAGEKFSQAATS